MTQPSGWYDDPQDPSQLRYWDGVVWSSHVTPRVSPTVEQSSIGMPYGVTPAAARPHAPGSQGAQGAEAPPGFQPPGPGQGGGQQGPSPQDQGQHYQGQHYQGQQYPGQQGQGQPGEGQPGGQWPPYGQGPGPYGQQPMGWASNLPTTPDGVVLSGWWKRVLASIIDNILVTILALPLTFFPLQRAGTILADYIEKVIAAAQAGSSTMPVLPTEVEAPILQASLILLAVNLAYEIGFLTRTGATIGKKVVGISVRLRDKAGPPPLVAVLKRTAVKRAGSIVGSVPNEALSFFASTFGLVDVLWPLWDSKKQAIHDKVGATNVVVGPQPKRDA